MERLQLGSIEVDPVTFEGAIDAIDALVSSGAGGAVFTPNVDHVVQAEEDERLRSAYASAALSLADGAPLLWAAKLLGRPLPAKVSGSDLFEPLMRRAAAKKWRVYLLGASTLDTAKAAADKLVEMGVNVVGFSSPWVTDPTDVQHCVGLMQQVQSVDADLLIVAMGAPKQELLIHTGRAALGKTVAIGLGATLEFFTGKTQRAPRWMSNAGFEWLYRLMQEPGRLWKRYLLRDPAFFRIIARTMLQRRRPALLQDVQRSAAWNSSRTRSLSAPSSSPS